MLSEHQCLASHNSPVCTECGVGETLENNLNVLSPTEMQMYLLSTYLVSISCLGPVSPPPWWPPA